MVGAVLLFALAPGVTAQDLPGTSDAADSSAPWTSAGPDSSSAALTTLPPPDATGLPESFVPPPGTRIAWVDGADTEAPAIHVTDTDGTGDPGPLVEGTAPSWAPDGRRFAYGCPATDEQGFPGAIRVHELGRETGDAVVIEAGLASTLVAGRRCHRLQPLGRRPRRRVGP